MTGKTITKHNGYILLFGYPMDNSVRPIFILNLEAIEEELDKFKDIRYFICAFKTEEVIIPKEPTK